MKRSHKLATAAGVAVVAGATLVPSCQAPALSATECEAVRAEASEWGAVDRAARQAGTLDEVEADHLALTLRILVTALAECEAQTTTTTPGGASTIPSTTVPPATGFPDATNTGPTGTLQPRGTITTSVAGQVIENVAITGDVYINHSNVTLRNFSLRGRIYINGPVGLVVEDCELDGGGYDGAAIAEHNYTLRRCEVRGYADGLRVNGNVTIEDNWVHTFPDYIAQGAHQDAVQVTSGSNIVIRHNTLHIGVDGCNAAVMIGSYSGSNILVERNLLTAACGFVAYGGDGQYTDVRYIENRISTLYHPMGGFHGVFAQAEQATLEGNVWADGPNAGRLAP